jgi:oxygen-independent coproporphyrinogen-3 oxidase
MAALKNEWKFYQNILGEKIVINSLYIGGGTPNFLNANDLDDLLSSFSTNQSTQITIELDPRFISIDQLDVLKKHNVHTLSFGIQDLKHEVLENVNREQDIQQILDVLNKARELAFPQINIDLIYGLNHQTRKSLVETLEHLKESHADSIALYPFAKVPWQNNSQKAFGDFKDFSRTEMNELFSGCNLKLHDLGYEHIGMGHFARVDSNFHAAFKQKRLKRNIMGFTEKKSNLLIGLGVSAFSSTSTGHIQNEKVLEQYLFAIQKERAPVFKSHAVTNEELELSKLFEKIICQNIFSKNDLFKILPEQKGNFDSYLKNNFITEIDDNYIVTELGRFFLKNICQCWG